MASKKQRFNQAFNKLAEPLDARERVMSEVWEILKSGQDLPPALQHLEKYANEKPWRQDRKAFRRIVKAAKIAARNNK
jgi:hypothetical protein